MRNIIASLIIFFSTISDIRSEQQIEYTEIKPYIIEKYDVDLLLYTKVLLVANANSGPVFKANDILAIIGIESSWNPKAKSSHGAIGLTQIIPKYWKVDHKIETQVETTYKILNEYYSELKDKNKTIIAYNCGLTNFKQGKCGKKYLRKFNKELKEIEENEV
jgi:hypothetical protein